MAATTSVASTNGAKESLWALVLAGGDGTRLQRLTRLITGAPIPKQYCRIDGRWSLLQTTLWRIAPLVSAERTLAIVNRDHLPIARSQLTSLDRRNVLVQPRNLDTGPGVLVSLLELARRDPDATLAIFPSDHYIRDGAAFRATIGRMRWVVAQFPHKIALLGIRPEHADSGYGYISLGNSVGLDGGTFAVAAFNEKPAVRVAADMICRGALWNSLVIVARVRRLVELLRALRPDDVALLEETPLELAAVATAYERMTAWNFSHEFLSRIPEHLVVTRGDDLGWSDWGTPEAIERSFAAMGVVPPWRRPLEAANRRERRVSRRGRLPTADGPGRTPR